MESTSLPWDHSDSDPLSDVLAMAEVMGFPAWPLSGKRGGKGTAMTEYYTGFELSKSPGLAYCSRCGTKRITLADPWVVTKECPTCGHVDPVSSSVPASMPAPSSALERTPETITLAEVQRLLVGALRQVDGNKVIIHPTEFDLTGVTLLQETNTETGTVTIWFEKQSDDSSDERHEW